ncbi:MAG: HlyD family efflux transporter periplasmic adaptor subunit [Clostridia bacterium]|nr:HlyD family efflux transporter periplasmic adaptor subunit [Clostridia bacterium]
MEQVDSAYETLRKQKAKKKKIRTAIIWAVIILILAIGGFMIYRALSAAKETPAGGVLRYRYVRIAEGEIHTTITGSTTLSAADSASFTAAADARVEAVYKAPGETIEEGETVMELSSSSLENKLEDLYADLLKIQTKMTGITKTKSNLNITAVRKGTVKDIRVSEGDAVDSSRYLCLISTDGLMKITIDAAEGLRPYETVQVTVGSSTVPGTVEEIKNGKATVTIQDSNYAVGESASVGLPDGTSLGSGKLEVNEAVVITSTPGQIAEVKVSENQEVKKNAVLFVLASGAYTSTYQSYYEQEQDLLDQISAIEDQLTIKAEWPALVTSISVKAGDDVSSGAALCSLTASSGYQISLGIDELDVKDVSIGQDAKITLDAIEDQEYTGTVTNLSYAGTGSYVTTYTATITTEPIEGAYPGMSADVEIYTSSSGVSLLVPVNAVQYEGDSTFVYLVPDGFDQSQSESVDLDSFTKISVETGMSNGSYIVITGEDLQVGDFLCVPTMETTSVYSPSTSSNTSMTMFGGMGGASMPSGMSGSMPSGMGGSMPSGMGSGERPRGDFSGGNWTPRG